MAHRNSLDVWRFAIVRLLALAIYTHTTDKTTTLSKLIINEANPQPQQPPQNSVSVVSSQKTNQPQHILFRSELNLSGPHLKAALKAPSLQPTAYRLISRCGPTISTAWHDRSSTPIIFQEIEFNSTCPLLSDPKICKHIQYLFNPCCYSTQTIHSQNQIWINGLVYSLLLIYNSIESLSVIHKSSDSEEEDTKSLPNPAPVPPTKPALSAPRSSSKPALPAPASPSKPALPAPASPSKPALPAPTSLSKPPPPASLILIPNPNPKP
ncbi:hypothetical protein PGT21_017048 [Puccinia graminis f. sp. tritici]|uniref:Uncharacterized protein n=1 Tax=Puccinia graminis f. sp. tritici TaxID=56615 RepID=A0A5B0MNU8_PUCGR|nr:hypothetical protein PGT21_017048 [Puccinia graminis f. sp. tritici]